jgi:hypothetical protein
LMGNHQRNNWGHIMLLKVFFNRISHFLRVAIQILNFFTVLCTQRLTMFIFWIFFVYWWKEIKNFNLI